MVNIGCLDVAVMPVGDSGRSLIKEEEEESGKKVAITHRSE